MCIVLQFLVFVVLGWSNTSGFGFVRADELCGVVCRLPVFGVCGGLVFVVFDSLGFWWVLG